MSEGCDSFEMFTPRDELSNGGLSLRGARRCVRVADTRPRRQRLRAALVAALLAKPPVRYRSAFQEQRRNRNAPAY
jgi:hypothetical protein